MSNCFVVMPFRPELHYVYNAMKQHIEANFPGVSCARGDDSILTVPILEKIGGYIKQADVVIADCTGRNPNVFYELGMAHALEKPVVLITSDEVEDAPTDIRAFEFIRYSKGPKEFLSDLDKALRVILGNPFDELYDVASKLFQEFRTDKKASVTKVGKEEFTTAASAKAFIAGVPRSDDLETVATLFLPLMIQGPADLDVMLKIKEWIQQKFPH